MNEPARRSVALLVVGALTVMGIAGCGGDDEPPDEVGTSWRRGQVFPHQDVYFEFDRVAVGGGADTVAWVTRRPDGETDELAYWEIEGGREAIQVELPAPETAGGPPVLIPVDVATDQTGWAALAATRDRPNGTNTGLLAWRARRTSERLVEPPAAEALRPPAGRSGAPDVATVARSGSTITVAALYDGEPVMWVTRDGSGPGSGSGAGDRAGAASWEAVEPDLGVDTELVSIRVSGDGDRLVLAGVDDRSRAHVWTSTDGGDWEAVDRGDLPTDVGAVALVAPLGGGQMGIAWLADDDSAPWNATSVTVQRLDGDGITDEGAVVSDGDAGIDRVDLEGLARSPSGRLVAVGAALQASGDTTPMVWVQDGDAWRSTRQPELVGRLDYEFRAVTAATDRLLVGLMTGVAHIDVEAWRWLPPE